MEALQRTNRELYNEQLANEKTITKDDNKNSANFNYVQLNNMLVLTVRPSETSKKSFLKFEIVNC